MFKCKILLGIGFLSIFAANPARAGYYSTIDTPEEMRYSLDYGNVFRDTLSTLRTISDPAPKNNPPIRRRYVLIESLAREKLDTLEQKLNYSAVLIRRGKADEAVQLLLQMEREHPDNFLVLSHSATAHFLGSPDFRRKAPSYMKQALRLWPKHWDDLKEEDKKFLTSFGWESTAFERYRKYETYFERLIRNRLDEEKKLARKEEVPKTVDPIFVGDDGKPVRFVNENGDFEPGRIAPAEKAKLEDDAVEAVEQLLIWMPLDDRLQWLLAEVFNASAMKYKNEEQKNRAIKNAFLIFNDLDNIFGRTPYGKQEIKKRREILSEYEPIHRPERVIDPTTKEITGDPDAGDMMGRKWFRTLAVGFITGFAVGLFALWQFQEMRRRRQTRAAARS